VVDRDVGSDPERPWRLAQGLGQRGFRVVLVARSVGQVDELGPNVELESPLGHRPTSPVRMILDRANLYLHARRIAHREIASGRALVVHHVGPCSPNSPSLIGNIPVPFVYGPMPAMRKDPYIGGEWLSWLGAPRAGSIQAHMSKAATQSVSPLAYSLWTRTVHRADVVTIEAQANRWSWIPRMAVIPPGVDQTFFRASDPKKVITGRVITVGNLEFRKGYDVLFRAISRVACNHQPVSLLVVGSGPEEQSLRELAIQLGIDSLVTFAGKVPRMQLPSLLQSAEAFCHPARSDTFPLSVLEAMACSLPTLVSSAGALPEIVAAAGLVHNAGDVGQLAGDLLAVLTKPLLRRSLGTAARCRVLDCFTWQAMCDSYADLYVQLARTKRSRHGLD
jgi:glycosyltransferase involved in cell wall biosynthesis